jgi:anti-sigma B factor antagonist
MSFEIKVKKVNNVPVLELVGRAIDLDAQKFSRKLKSMYRQGAKRIVVDMSRTEFLDSQALGIVVYYDTLMRKEGRRLVILNGNPDQCSYVHRLFELTNLDKVIMTITSMDKI